MWTAFLRRRPALLRYARAALHYFNQDSLVCLLGDGILHMMYLRHGVVRAHLRCYGELNQEEVSAFLDRFHGAPPLKVILFDKNAEIITQELPLLQHSAVDTVAHNAIKKFVSHDDYYTYKLHEEVDQDGIYRVKFCLILAKNNPAFAAFFSFLASARYCLSGVYLSSSIITEASEHLLGQLPDDKPCIYINPTFCGIEVLYSIGKVILGDKIVDYPHDKSMEYLQGIIENELNDAIIALRGIFKERGQILGATRCILLLPYALEEAFKNFSLPDVDIKVCKTTSSLNSIMATSSDEFFASVCTMDVYMPAINKSLLSFRKLKGLAIFLNTFIFVSLLAAIYFGLRIETQINRTESEVHQLQMHYMTLANLAQLTRIEHDKIKDYEMQFIDVLNFITNFGSTINVEYITVVERGADTHATIYLQGVAKELILHAVKQYIRDKYYSLDIDLIKNKYQDDSFGIVLTRIYHARLT